MGALHTYSLCRRMITALAPCNVCDPVVSKEDRQVDREGRAL